MSNTYNTIQTASGTISKYKTLADFPIVAESGQLAVALDTSVLYIYSGSLEAWVVSGGGGGSGIDDVVSTNSIQMINTAGIASSNLRIQESDTVSLSIDTNGVRAEIKGNAYNVETRTISLADINNEYLILDKAPLVKELTVVIPEGGSVLSYGSDFIVTNDNEGRRLSWNSRAYASLVEQGDVVVITYV